METKQTEQPEQKTNAQHSPSLLAWLQQPAGRLQQRRAMHDTLASLWLALAASVVILVGAHLWPIPSWRIWAGLPLCLWLSVHLVRFFLLRPTAMRTARQLDRELGLKERLATALELEEQADRSPLATAQRADAVAHAQRVHPSRDLPWRVPKRALALAGALLVATLILFFLPNAQDALLQQRAAIRQAAEEQAEQLEELAEQISDWPGLTPEEREELARQLNEAAEELRRNRGDTEEAVADIEEARQALQEAMERRAERQRAVDAAEEALRAMAREINQGNEAALEAMLEGIEALPELLENLSDEQIAELAMQMAELARRAAADPELARSLQQLADALEAQDPEAAAQAIEAVVQALERAEVEITEQAQAQAALEEALAQMEAAEDALGQAGGEQAGTGSETGQDAQTDAAAGEGSGTGSGSDGGDTGSGEDGSGQGGDWYQDPNRPNLDEAGPPGEEVYVPLGPGGQPAYIPGQDTGEGTDTDTLPSLEPEPGEDGVAVPYDAVYRYYEDAAGQAMERTYIPPGLREYVRSYFSGLEP